MASKAVQNVGTAAAYDVVAEAYAETYFAELERKPFDREVTETFAAELKGKGRVADIGCGPGQVARFLTALGVDTLGLDFSPEMVSLARKLNLACCFELGDMRALNLLDGALSGAVVIYSLIHLARHEVVPALRELRRVLRPGGPFLASFHIGEGETHPETWFGRDVSLDFTFFGTEEMTGYAEKTGFALERVQPRPAYPFEVQTARAYLWLHRPEL